MSQNINFPQVNHLVRIINVWFKFTVVRTPLGTFHFFSISFAKSRPTGPNILNPLVKNPVGEIPRFIFCFCVGEIPR